MTNAFAARHPTTMSRYYRLVAVAVVQIVVDAVICSVLSIRLLTMTKCFRCSSPYYYQLVAVTVVEIVADAVACSVLWSTRSLIMTKCIRCLSPFFAARHPSSLLVAPLDLLWTRCCCRHSGRS
eukprot:scaffold34204_cov39-Attheya_sp.AAC.3